MRFSKAFVALSAPFLFTSAAPAYKRAANPTDILVLKFATALNQLESTFYSQALAKFKDADFTNAGFTAAQIPLEQFKQVQTDEQAHIAFLTDALKAVGDVPIAGCKFDFSSVLGDVATMAAVSRVVENVGVSAFIGAASLLVDKNILGNAATILPIESRHQSILNIMNGGTAIPQAFDMGLTPSSVLALAGGFVSGCDFGIPANPPLTISSPPPVGPNSKLTFTSPGIDQAKAAGQPLFCAMLTGGDVFSQTFPIDNCVVPPNIDGPVYIYITNSSQPLAGDVNIQCSSCIAAGPTLAFIDSQQQSLSSLARTSGTGKAISADPAAGTPSGSTPPAVPGSAAPGSAAPAPAPGASDPAAPAPGTSAPAPGASAPGTSTSGSAAPGSSSSTSSGAAPTGSAAAPGTPAQAAAGTPPGLSNFDGKVVVVGSFTIPKDQAAPAAGSSSAPASTASAASASAGGPALVLPTSADLTPVQTST